MTTGLTRDEQHQYRWNGGPVLPSVTSILKVQDSLVGTDGLVYWAAGIAVDHALTHRYRDDIRSVRAEALAATKGPANTGTDVHEQVRRLIVGEDITPTAITAPYLAQFAAFLAKHRPDFIAAEELVANLELGYAGQFDFVARLGGKTACVDIKTGKEKPTFVLQIAAYTDPGNFIGRPGEETQYPMPETDAGFVLLLRPDGYQLVPATPTKADRAHFRELAAAWHKARRWADACKTKDTEEEAA